MRLIGNSDFKDKRKLKEIGIFWKITKELLSYTTKGFIIDLVTQSDKNFMIEKNVHHNDIISYFKKRSQPCIKRGKVLFSNLV